jgi:hypothetical protein
VSGIAILVFDVAADLHGHESAATLNRLRGSVRQIWTTPAFRLNAAARLTIASHGASSHATPVTDQGTDHSKPRPVGRHLKTTADLHQQ